MIVVCIPAYNEEKNIKKTIEKTKEFADKIILCDDGSTDNTFTISNNLGIDIIRHEKNLGKGAALRSLFNRVKTIEADVVVTIDADGQFLPSEIPKLISPILENNYDLVIGYRFEDNDEMPRYRKIGNKMLDRVTNLAADLPFRDTQSGFRAYSMNAISVVNFDINGFGADAEILVSASKANLKITEIKITVLYNTGSKTSTKNPMSHFVGVVISLIELIALKRPLSLLGIPGTILLIMGIILATVVVGTFNETRYFSIPFTLLSFGTVITGLMFLLMSVLLFAVSKNQRMQN
jgi:glycosyltransferase involved in cell wall biosynthesis